MTHDATLKKTRSIGLVTATAIVVANMVGTGVFTSLAFQVKEIPTGFPIILLWLTGGVLAFCGAVCYAELGAMLPRSGGEYHYLREAYLPVFGFLAGWISITVGFAGAIAAAAVAFGEYMGSVFGIASVWLAVSVVLCVSIIHLGSTKSTTRFQNLFTWGKIALISVFAVAAFSMTERQPISFAPRVEDGEVIFSGVFANSLVFVMFAYSGWNAAAYVAGEIKDVKRTLPTALLIGTVFVTLLYVALNAAFLYATPVTKMVVVDSVTGDAQPVVDVGLVAAREVFGHRGGDMMGLLISFGLISAISAMTWAGPRVTAMMGEDYRLFARLATRNRHGVPAGAILLQTLLVLVMVTASFEQLINYVQATLILSSLLTVSAVIWLRHKRPATQRPYCAWGYPVTPVLFIVMNAYMLYFLVLNRVAEVLWGVGTLGIGFVLYCFTKIRDKPSSNESETEPPARNTLPASAACRQT